MTSTVDYSDIFDLRDVVEILDEMRDSEKRVDEIEDHEHEAMALMRAFIDDGLASDEDGFRDYAKNEPAVIPAHRFEDYARELADELGLIPDNASWPLNCIDWEFAARELQHDYSAFDCWGSRFYVRSY